MSFIHLYLDKENNSNDKFINLLKSHNIDFLQYNIENNETNLNAYKLESIPAIKFKNSIIHDVNEESMKIIVEEFNNFVDSLPTIIRNTEIIDIEPTITLENINTKKKFKSIIPVDTIKVSDKEKLTSCTKNFSNKYKT